MGTGKASKRMQDQFEQATPQEKQTMYDEWIQAKGEWGTLELREHLTQQKHQESQTSMAVRGRCSRTVRAETQRENAQAPEKVQGFLPTASRHG